MSAPSVVDLVGSWLADILTPGTTPANATKAANREDSCGSAADATACERLRISANPVRAPAADDAHSQTFAGIRKPENGQQSEHWRGFSQDSQDSQGLPRTILTCSDCAIGQTASGDPSRPYRLAKDDGDAAHAEPWDQGAIGRFTARAHQFQRRGFAEQDAEDLAERLHLRDVQADDRRMCLECRHLSGSTPTGWRCLSHRAARIGGELAGDLVTALQRCPGARP